MVLFNKCTILNKIVPYLFTMMEFLNKSSPRFLIKGQYLTFVSVYIKKDDRGRTNTNR